MEIVRLSTIATEKTAAMIHHVEIRALSSR